jgi:regulatory protein
LLNASGGTRLGGVRPPKKVAGDQELYAAAVNALARRAYSVFEMKQYLERRAKDSDEVGPVMARLREQRLLDDARYAFNFARFRARTRRQGRFRIQRELRARGVSDGHIEAAIEQTFRDADEALLARSVIERRLRALRGPLDQRKAASLYRVLLRSGFDTETIRRELRAATRDRAITSVADEYE